jgi:hypothetical protein
MTRCNRDPLLTKHLCDGRVSIPLRKEKHPGINTHWARGSGVLLFAKSIALVIQLQSELDLPGIVGSIASGSNLAEGRVRKVAGAAD